MSEQKEVGLLLWLDGEEIKGQWPLAQPVVTIGRSDDSGIQVDDRWVSRRHCRVRRVAAGYLIEDLGSRNGTFVNGRRIEGPIALSDGDEVQVAPLVKFTFVGSGATAPLPAHGPGSGLELDHGARQVWVNGQVLVPPLSHAQFTLLALLAEQPGRVYSRDEIVAAVWQDDQAEGISDEAIDALVRRIRLSLRRLDPAREYLVTVRGYGFKLEAG